MIAQINPAILKLGQDVIREFSADSAMGLTTAAWVKQEEGWESTQALSHSAPILLKANEYLNYPENSAFIQKDDYGIHVADVYFVYRLDENLQDGTTDSAPGRH